MSYLCSSVQLETWQLRVVCPNKG